MRKKTLVFIPFLLTIVVSLWLLSSCKNDDDDESSDQSTPGTVINPGEKTGSVSDVDGNVYKIVKIGKKWWMAENLRTTKYNDGTAIPLISDKNVWATASAPGYCWYNNNEIANKDSYGALYNGYAISTGKLCPVGWHVPSDDEWAALDDYLGIENSGNMLKEAGTAHWDSPNTGATNETGFTALPGGFRSSLGLFCNMGHTGHWWSSTEVDSEIGYVSIRNDVELLYVGGDDDKRNGHSIRCIKN